MYYIISQIVGAIAYIFLAFSYFKKQKKGILFTQIISLAVFSIHFYMLDGITGAICNILELIALIVIFLFDKYNLKNKKFLIVGMIPIAIVISIFTYQNLFSIFPILACILTISSFLTSKERVIRGIGVVSTFCWLVYAVSLQSWITIIFEVITLIFVVAAFVKNEKR